MTTLTLRPVHPQHPQHGIALRLPTLRLGSLRGALVLELTRATARPDVARREVRLAEAAERHGAHRDAMLALGRATL